MGVDEDLIEFYMNLGDKIFRTEERMKERRATFYAQTMSSVSTYDEEKWFSRAFSVEWNTIAFLDEQGKAERYLRILHFKEKHFRRFFTSLNYRDQRRLILKYRHYEEILMESIEALCMEEIGEIEEATSRQFKGYRRAVYLSDIQEEEGGLPELGELNDEHINQVLAELGVN